MEASPLIKLYFCLILVCNLFFHLGHVFFDKFAVVRNQESYVVHFKLINTGKIVGDLFNKKTVSQGVLTQSSLSFLLVSKASCNKQRT